MFFHDADKLVLIDTGFKGDHKKIFRALGSPGKQPEDIKHIILTHSHPDHAGSEAEIKRRTGADIYMHGEDAALA